MAGLRNAARRRTTHRTAARRAAARRRRAGRHRRRRAVVVDRHDPHVGALVRRRKRIAFPGRKPQGRNGRQPVICHVAKFSPAQSVFQKLDGGETSRLADVRRRRQDDLRTGPVSPHIKHAKIAGAQVSTRFATVDTNVYGRHNFSPVLGDNEKKASKQTASLRRGSAPRLLVRTVWPSENVLTGPLAAVRGVDLCLRKGNLAALACQH